jgi:predicted ATP-dependent endonuclease of OLD family
MHLSRLEIQGYRLFRDCFPVGFEPGLTVLLGENGTGKSAIVDAVRLLLFEDGYRRTGISSSDFNRLVDDPAASGGTESVAVRCVFDELHEEAQHAYLPWLDIEDPSKAYLSLTVENKEDPRGRFRRVLWGGESASGLFEWELLSAIGCAYLPPLRNAQSKLGAYRGSRLSRLLRNLGLRELEEDEQHPVERRVKAFNDRLLSDPTIQKATGFVRQNVLSAVGPVFGQDTTIQFSEVKFERIIERLELLFYPRLPSGDQPTARDLFRELGENSMGFNNILYLATVLAELEDLTSSEVFLKILLVEEPEAHLHPQLQTKLLRYLEEKAENSDIQVIVTSHSPLIAASVDLDSIKVLTRPDIAENPLASSIADCGLSPENKFFLERWLDVTKSTLLFAKGMVLVEGIAEALVLPELARRVLADMNGGRSDDARPDSLKDYGVSVISMGGIYLTHFLQLFKGYHFDGDGNRIEHDRIPVRCAGITDCDPDKEARPTADSVTECRNRQHFLVEELADHPNCRVFSNLKTFEYDLALQDNNLQLLSRVYLATLDTSGSNRRKAEELSETDWTTRGEDDRAEAANWLLDHIESKGQFAQLLAQELAKGAETEISVPLYIEQAVRWAIGLDIDEER